MYGLKRLLTASLLTAALCTAAWAEQPKLKDDLVLPDGIGKAKLGMSLTEVRAVMPSMVVDENVFAKADPPVPFKYATGQLKDQPFGDVKGCELTLHFYRERFIYYGVVCPDRAVIEAYLLKQFGAPGSKRPEVWQWTTHPRSMTFAPVSGAIAVMDNQGIQPYQLDLFNITRSAQQPPAAPAAATPAAPAAAAKP